MALARAVWPVVATGVGVLCLARAYAGGRRARLAVPGYCGAAVALRWAYPSCACETSSVARLLFMRMLFYSVRAGGGARCAVLQAYRGRTAAVTTLHAAPALLKTP